MDWHVGSIVEVSGHTIAGDGGKGKYEVVAGATYPEGACGVFEFDNGVQGAVIFECDESTINPLKYSGGFMNKEIDFMHIEDGDVISIEARANKHDGEKYISLELSHKCNEGSVMLWLSELKKLVEILEGSEND